MKGDNAARAELYQTYSPRLMALCLRYASCRTEAEDWLHDTYVRVFDQMGRFRWRGEGSLRAWLETVARHVAIDNLRRESTRAFVPLDETTAEQLAPAAEPTPDDIDRLSMDELLQLISELPHGYRVVFNLFCIDGCSHKEIARLLGIKESSSSSQLARAKALLAARIRERIRNQE